MQADEVFLPIDIAIPCGLVVNELFSNALKHAFPQGKKGSVWIELSQDPSGGYTLCVRDDGIGIPPEIDIRQTRTLGMQLVTSLVEQLDGTVSFDRQDGTTFTLTFPKPRSAAR